MAKGKNKAAEDKGKKLTLKMAMSCVKQTLDGKRRLDLSNQGIAIVPKCIQKLCDVYELDLSRNLLKKLPDFIDKFVNLRLLDLHSNYLETIPESIGRLQNLVTLNLCNNRLSTGSLPNGLGLLEKLHHLNLGLNHLETLPHFISALKDLRHLGLFNNRLTRDPECLGQLSKLEKINVEGNPFHVDCSLDPIDRVESLYLVSEGSLCGKCLRKCQEARRRLEDPGKVALKTKMNFTGLVSPTSMPRADPGTWR